MAGGLVGFLRILLISWLSLLGEVPSASLVLIGASFVLIGASLVLVGGRPVWVPDELE